MLLPRRPRAMVLMGLLMAACGTPSPSPGASGTPGRPSPSAPAPVATPTGRAGPSAGPGASAAADEPVDPNPPALALEEVAGALAAPINVASTPEGWLLVNERDGRIIAIDPADGSSSLALDFTDRVLGGGEQGLLGLALHPHWPDEPRALVHYTDRNGGTVLSEVAAAIPSDGPPTLDPDSERIMLQVEQPYANHNGGQLAFGPDGYLYMGLGDGGSGGDPHGHGQDPRTLLGSILRLDVDVADGYAIPPDNPFADGGGGAPEVFLYGLRNPWRFSFDRATGMLWIADVGQNAFEEVDRIDPTADAGANLGWNVMEASHCFVAADCSSDGLTGPLAEYGRDLGCSITGGHVYRGEGIPRLRGWYLFSDYCTGLLFGVPSDADGLVTPPRILAETGAGVSAFGEGADGELYLADINGGSIYRIVADD